MTISDVEPSPSSSRRRAGQSTTKETVTLSEEEQLLLAIQNSIRESQSDNVLPDDNDVIEDSDADSEPLSAAKRARTIDSADTFTNYLGSKAGESHNLNVFFQNMNPNLNFHFVASILLFNPKFLTYLPPKRFTNLKTV